MSERRICLALRHVGFEGLGVLADLLPEYGFATRICEVGIEDVPEAEIASCDLLIVLGGPIGVYETESYPFLAPQMAAIGRRLAEKKPTLGICLGAQMMAASLGARVGPGPAKEIGYAPVQLTPGGLASLLAPLAGEMVLHWHGDNFGMPRGAARLAFTDACPNQAFVLDSYGLGLQFHIEVEPDRLESWLIGHAVELSKAGVRPNSLRKQAAQYGEATAAAGRKIFRAWLDGAFA